MNLESWLRHSRAAVAAACLLALSPTVAKADWLRAESDRFIVYSEGGEHDLRRYVQKLDMFDRTMAFRAGLSSETAPVRKMTIYLVRNRRGLLRVHPSSAESTAGTYFPTDEDIFAVAIDSDGGGMSGEAVLMHEYAHHFMLNNFPGAYPAWFVEGFAEYQMTADIDVDGGEVILGKPNENRAYWIMAERWIPLDELLTKRPGEIRDASDRHTYYPIAWLLTHWFYSDPARSAQLQTYLKDVAQGADSVAAMESATGMRLSELRSALRRYTRNRLTGRQITGRFPTPTIEITRLPPSANDLLLINQRLKVGVPENDRAALGQEVARLAARHGDDPLALLAAGHAGLHFGDKAAGERALVRLLELDPDHLEALQYLAEEKISQAHESDDPTAQTALRREARDLLARAYTVAENDFRTLMLLTELRQWQPGFPNDNDILTMGLALDRAPQLAVTRIRYATALAHKGQTEEAIAALRPLSNNPHEGAASTYATRAIAALEAGESMPAPSEEAEAPQISEPDPETPAPEEPAGAEPQPSGG